MRWGSARRGLALPAIRALLLALGVSVAAPYPARAAEPPFDAGLNRLAEVLGSLHFLSSLCGRHEADWRAEMETLLDAERPDAERRARFVASFNRGYRAFADTYRSCTPSASAAWTLYRKEGETLSRGLADRFGN